MDADPTMRMLGPITYEEAYAASYAAACEEVATQMRAIQGDLAASFKQVLEEVSANLARAQLQVQFMAIGLSVEQIERCVAAGVSPGYARFAHAISMDVGRSLRLGRQLAALPLGARKVARRKRKRRERNH